MDRMVVNNHGIQYVPIDALEEQIIAEIKKHGRSLGVLHRLCQDVQFTLTCRLTAPGGTLLTADEFRTFWRSIFQMNLISVEKQAELFGIPEASMWNWLSLLMSTKAALVPIVPSAFKEVLQSALRLMRDTIAEQSAKEGSVHQL